jgi:hypothetical protein
VKLDKTCDPCVTMICAAKPSCCNSQWGPICVNDVAAVCGDPMCGTSTCAHNVCITGVALDPACDPCVASVCLGDSFCCSTLWDSICVSEAQVTCPSCP